jgi:PAS domain S-box-containing protein
MKDKINKINATHVAMMENIGDVIAIMEINGITKYQSPNIEKWFGWKPKDVIGKNGWKFVHPDDLRWVQKEFKKLLLKKTNTVIEFRFKHKNNGYKWIELTAINKIKNPLINGILMNYHDITERKNNEIELKIAKEKAEKNEKKYKSLFNSMQEGSYLHELVYDNQGKAINYRIIDANPASEKNNKIKVKNAIGKLATELFNTTKAPFLETYIKVAETGEPYTFEHYFEPMKIYFLISAFSPKKGEFATTFLNITQSKKHEKELIFAKEKAEISEKYLDSIINNIGDPVFVKDLSFQHEKEFRIVMKEKVRKIPQIEYKKNFTRKLFEDAHNKRYNYSGISIKLEDFNSYNFEVVHHPKSEDWAKENINQIIDKFKMGFKISESELNLK